MEFMHMGRGMSVGWAVVVSVLFATCAVNARVWQQNEVEFHLLPNLDNLSDIYRNGSLNVTFFEVTEQQAGSPKPLLIASPDPKEDGVYPVIVLQHGFDLSNTFYSQMMFHVASHGFIVVAPQMYWITFSQDATEEICNAVNVINWFPRGLPQVMSERFGEFVQPNLKKVALAGHSRGGKVAFGVATGVVKRCGKPSLTLSAIAGLDPVDGPSSTEHSEPPILHDSPHDLQLEMPTLIVGSGLGPDYTWIKILGIFRKRLEPCAPLNVSHASFYDESDAPAFHFVAPEYGHTDFLDDVTGGWIFGPSSYSLCKRNDENGREPMRRFSGGILVAFFNAVLKGDKSQFCAAVSEKLEAPVTLDKPDSYGSFCASNTLSQT